MLFPKVIQRSSNSGCSWSGIDNRKGSRNTSVDSSKLTPCNMQKKELVDSISIETEDLNKNSESLNAINDRRKALAKIGRFSAYVVPATLAIINSKPAHASV